MHTQAGRRDKPGRAASDRIKSAVDSVLRHLLRQAPTNVTRMPPPVAPPPGLQTIRARQDIDYIRLADKGASYVISLDILS